MARPSPLALSVLAVALLTPAPFVATAGAAGSPTAGDGPTLQMLADATLIDAQCGTVNTMFGAVFRYGEAHGIRSTDIMLLGKRRADFQSAYDRRIASTAREEICGSLLARYQDAFPDWFATR